MSTEHFMAGIAAALSSICILSCTPETKVIWTEADIPEGAVEISPNGLYEKAAEFKETGIYEMLVCNPPKGLDWELWGIFPTRDKGVQIEPVYTEELSMERFDGKLHVMTPRISRDTLRFLYRWGRLPGYGWVPRKLTLKAADGREKRIRTEYRFIPATPEPVRKYVRKAVGLCDMIPQIKNVEYLEGETPFDGTLPDVVRVSGKPDGWYRIVTDGRLGIEAADHSGEVYALNTLERIAHDGKVPNVRIEDWPDVPFRVMMLSLSGMFYPVDDLKQTIDIMSRYRMNTLHLHLSDDSGWRIAIDGLPELTEYGAVHHLPVKLEDGTYYERDGLMMSGMDDGYENGYYTREQFVDIIRYAESKAVKIIPEIDMPAHSKASVRAMEIRAARTGNTDFLLTDPADTSRTMSHQGYKRNTINVTMPSTWRFIEKVVDQFVEMYREAGSKLEYFHIGGDEVPDGVWMGSPEAQKFMAETGLSTKGDLRGYFICRMIDLLSSKGVKTCGWSSMSYNVRDSVRQRIRDEVAYLNCGQTVGDPRLEHHLYGLANDGIHCCINCCGNTYMGNAYSPSKFEDGFYYQGYTDERRAFSMMPFNLFPDGRYVLTKPESIVGVGTLMWFSVCHNVEEASIRLYPKVLSIFERAWNARPEGETASFDKFYSIVTAKEVPWMDENGIPHRRTLEAE